MRGQGRAGANRCCACLGRQRECLVCQQDAWHSQCAPTAIYPTPRPLSTPHTLSSTHPLPLPACLPARLPACPPACLQVRGSIPLLWSQTPCLKYKIPIRIAPPSRCEPVFAGHARDMIQGYQVCGGATFVQDVDLRVELELVS